MINVDNWTEQQVQLCADLIEQGYLDSNGRLTEKGRRQLDETHFWVNGFRLLKEDAA